MPKVWLITGSSRGLGRNLAEAVASAGHQLVATARRPGQLADLAARYPGQVLPIALDVTDPAAAERIERGVAICGSGVCASIAANKVPGVHAGLIHDVFSAHQGVEDDNMNVFCLDGNVIGSSLAWELLATFLAAHFSGAPRHLRRVAKVQALENQSVGS